MSEINYEQARFNMIEQQIRPWDVLDQRVLEIIALTPREAFVPARYRNLAFADVRIPLGHGQTMMNPNVEGRLLQALALTPTDAILEVGSGSGYLSACLAKLGASVLSVDIFADFSDAAGTILKRQGIRNVNLQTGNAARDWGNRLFDAIVITGSMPFLPETWKQRLALNGRLFAILGEEPIMEAMLVTRIGEQQWLSESLFDTELPPLIDFDKPKVFEF